MSNFRLTRHAAEQARNKGFDIDAMQQLAKDLGVAACPRRHRRCRGPRDGEHHHRLPERRDDSHEARPEGLRSQERGTRKGAPLLLFVATK